MISPDSGPMKFNTDLAQHEDIKAAMHLMGDADRAKIIKLLSNERRIEWAWDKTASRWSVSTMGIRIAFEPQLAPALLIAASWMEDNA